MSLRSTLPAPEKASEELIDKETKHIEVYYGLEAARIEAKFRFIINKIGSAPVDQKEIIHIRKTVTEFVVELTELKKSAELEKQSPSLYIRGIRLVFIADFLINVLEKKWIELNQALLAKVEAQAEEREEKITQEFVKTLREQTQETLVGIDALFHKLKNSPSPIDPNKIEEFKKTLNHAYDESKKLKDVMQISASLAGSPGYAHGVRKVTEAESAVYYIKTKCQELGFQTLLIWLREEKIKKEEREAESQRKQAEREDAAHKAAAELRAEAERKATEVVLLEKEEARRQAESLQKVKAEVARKATLKQPIEAELKVIIANKIKCLSELKAFSETFEGKFELIRRHRITGDELKALADTPKFSETLVDYIFRLTDEFPRDAEEAASQACNEKTSLGKIFITKNGLQKKLGTCEKLAAARIKMLYHLGKDTQSMPIKTIVLEDERDKLVNQEALLMSQLAMIDAQIEVTSGPSLFRNRGASVEIDNDFSEGIFSTRYSSP